MKPLLRVCCLAITMLAITAGLALPASAQYPPGATLTCSPSSVDRGTQVLATWSNIATPTDTDWIGVYAVGSADTAYLAFRYTDGNAAGQVAIFPAQHRSTGDYECRLFANNSYTLLATSDTYRIGPPPPTLSAEPSAVRRGEVETGIFRSIATPTDTDWIGLYPIGAANTSYLAFRYTDGNSSGQVHIPDPAQRSLGTYELRLFASNGYTLLAVSDTFFVRSEAAPTLTATPSTNRAGSAELGTWSNIATPTPTDWIGLYSVGSPDTAYLSFSYTTGDAGGSVSVPIPPGTPAGTYELRLFAANGYTLLATSNFFSVVA